MAAYDCPAMATCNPPPPVRVECPSDVSTLDNDRWAPRLGRMENGTCVETVAPTCPPTVETCQELPPREVACPADTSTLHFDRYVAPKLPPRIWRDDAGACWTHEEIKCPPPEVATCNPPPPRKVECPSDPKDLSFDRFKPTP